MHPLSRSVAMWKSKIAAVCLLPLCLCGCPELSSESPKVRTGSVGMTTEGIDDLAKPDSQAKVPNAAPAKPAANQ